MKNIIIPAPAKINLVLHITGILDNGYHSLEMIMQSISLHDIITIKKSDKLSLKTNHPDLPIDKHNLAYLAAELMINEFSLPGGVEIYIDKKIPIAAGLAGGSTDAAAVIRGINRLYQLNIECDKLLDLADRLGSDVPFCIQGGTTYAYGRGEKLKQLPDLAKTDLILIKPPIKVSTAEVYNKYDILNLKTDISVQALINILKEEKIITWQEGWANDLERVTINMVEEIKVIKRLLKEAGARFIMMSGSGPTVYAIVENVEHAQEIKKHWPRKIDFISYAYTIGKDFKELC